MTDYVKSTNFASKDALPTGNPLKIVKGTEIDTEFNNIATAVATKADLNSPTFLGTPAAPTATAGTNTTQIATTAFVQSHIVGTSQIADGAVTTIKLADGSVTTVKLAAGAATGAALGTDVVQTTGAQTIAGVKTFSSDPVMGVSGLTGNIAAARITNALNASGSAPIYACRTWVNFNGTGTVSINASGNVSSISDLGVGNYTINFSTALSDTNYARFIKTDSRSPENASFANVDCKVTSAATGSMTIQNYVGTTLTAADYDVINVAIFR